MARRSKAREVVLQMLYQIDVNPDVAAGAVRDMIREQLPDEDLRGLRLVAVCRRPRKPGGSRFADFDGGRELDPGPHGGDRPQCAAAAAPSSCSIPRRRTAS